MSLEYLTALTERFSLEQNKFWESDFVYPEEAEKFLLSYWALAHEVIEELAQSGLSILPETYTAHTFLQELFSSYQLISKQAIINTCKKLLEDNKEAPAINIFISSADLAEQSHTQTAANSEQFMLELLRLLARNTNQEIIVVTEDMITAGSWDPGLGLNILDDASFSAWQLTLKLRFLKHLLGNVGLTGTDAVDVNTYLAAASTKTIQAVKTYGYGLESQLTIKALQDQISMESLIVWSGILRKMYSSKSPRPSDAALTEIVKEDTIALSASFPVASCIKVPDNSSMSDFLSQIPGQRVSIFEKYAGYPSAAEFLQQ